MMSQAGTRSSVMDATVWHGWRGAWPAHRQRESDAAHMPAPVPWRRQACLDSPARRQCRVDYEDLQ
jgi:hypothetical protein